MPGMEPEIMSYEARKKKEPPRISIEVDKDLRAAFSKKARIKGASMTGLLVRWIREFLEGKLEI